jgi:transcriptional regulator with GAF, ATPase, and Fis domain
MNIARATEPAEGSLDSLGVDFLLSDDSESHALTGFHPSGKPLRSREMLIESVQKVAEIKASNASVNDIIRAVVEGLHSSLGLEFTTVCLRNERRALYHARISVGQNSADRQKNFLFDVDGVDDIFRLAMKNNADLTINDSTVTKVSRLLPDWHRDHFPETKSFIVLPLVVEKRCVGFLYGDRDRCAPEGIPPDEVSLIKALKGSLLSSLAKSGR